MPSHAHSPVANCFPNFSLHLLVKRIVVHEISRTWDDDARNKIHSAKYLFLLQLPVWSWLSLNPLMWGREWDPTICEILRNKLRMVLSIKVFGLVTWWWRCMCAALFVFCTGCLSKTVQLPALLIVSLFKLQNSAEFCKVEIVQQCATMF